MVRELRFRAWDKKYKCMEYFYREKIGIEYCCEEFQVSSGYDGMDRPTYEEDTSQQYEIMQYTGLKDRNGVDVYEGDVVEHKNVSYEIIFNNGRYLMEKRNRTRWDEDLEPWNFNDFLIIGNVHQLGESQKEATQ